MRKSSEISKVLKEKRAELGWNQKDFLMKIGMTQQQYQRIESGSDMRMSTLLRILMAMDLECVIVPKNKVREVELLLQKETDRVSEANGLPSFEKKLKDLED
ncbi:transcriptional regulator, y4mF family [Serratia quinivorans]|jgi:transcriptional regulator with XRE-family HTH domain|uniref:helix-turn-helix domain-containing protein n=1 Tax=Serratia TaxID=613 RepID=UPI000D93854A|nr:helix-turn-helix transcriptional regulator [Serratia quinivorans]MBV6693225.1 helix-turn-helix transcriptional regulator [Serratia quinivorans]CAI1055118.1 transcriptional regulator, y4mF family [Serratia quinivorans]CAI1917747.1 transcriptional regulator, y4mF family [Serratia quinivorans]SPZ61853.1 transcriptional regulator, y4mF family [Serratia quinivorans]VEI64410.1 transcriptional regulator, y4mF family [Serratia quinivorans]